MHFYSNGGFVRSTIDTLIEGSYWAFNGADKIIITNPVRNYREEVSVVILEPGVFITRQNLKGSDNILHIVE